MEGDEIAVADVPVIRRKAWELVGAIETVLGDSGDAKAVRSGMIDWRKEGF